MFHVVSQGEECDQLPFCIAWADFIVPQCLRSCPCQSFDEARLILLVLHERSVLKDRGVLKETRVLLAFGTAGKDRT